MGNTLQQYAYDIDGHQVENILQYGWTNNTWRGGSKDNYQFDENGKTVFEAHYTWNNLIEQWTGTYKYLYTYYISGNIETKIAQIYSSNSWVNNIKEVYDESTANMIEQYSWINMTWQINVANVYLSGSSSIKMSTNITYTPSATIATYEKTTNYYNNE